MHKDTGLIAHSNSFNMHGLSEIVVGYEGDGGMDSSPVRDWMVWIEKKNQWKGLSQAFKDRDVIEDNYCQFFKEPANEQERKQGYYD